MVAIDTYDQARVHAAAESAEGRVNDAGDRLTHAWEAVAPLLNAPASLLTILRERPTWLAGTVDFDADRACIATMSQRASPAERAEFLAAVVATPKARIERVCDLLLGTVKGVCGSTPPTLAGYAARGEDRRPLDAWITAQDMYDFRWIDASRPVAGGGPSTVMQLLSLADETTRQSSPSATRSQQHVLASVLRDTCSGRPGLASPRLRLPIDLLIAWHANGMAMDVAASVLLRPMDIRDPAANRARGLAIIGHLPADDIPAAGAWIIRHAGPEPAPTQDDRASLSDWHAMKAREAAEDHAREMRPYRRDALFLAVAAGFAEACCRHGAGRLDPAARQQLAHIGMDLVNGPRPQDIEQNPQRLQAPGLALLASLGDPA